MKKALVAVALAGAAMVATNASAAILTYDVNGLFSSGQTLSGSFSFDPNGGEYYQFTNFNIKVSGVPAFDSFNDFRSYGYNGPDNGTDLFSVGLGNGSGFVDINFTGAHTGFVLNSVSGTALSTETSFDDGEISTNLVSGTITNADAPAGAVPEPASWAMMILGMGAVGYSLRSAKRRSDEKFDAKIKRISYGVA